MNPKPECYFLRYVVNGRPYTIERESNGHSIRCQWNDTGEREWIPFTWFDNDKVEMDMSINEDYEYEQPGGFDHMST